VDALGLQTKHAYYSLIHSFIHLYQAAKPINKNIRDRQTNRRT